MNFFKWKIWLVTTFACLLPIVFGIFAWNCLPDILPIHFDINNNPDNFASKEFVVFALPVIMALAQSFACVILDYNAKVKGEVKKLEVATKWIMPIMSVVLQCLTLAIGLGKGVDVRRVVVVLVSCMLIVLGNYLPKANYIKNYNLDTQTAKKINRITGYGSVAFGILFLLSLFFPPIASVVCIIAMIVCSIVLAIYTVTISKRK